MSKRKKKRNKRLELWQVLVRALKKKNLDRDELMTLAMAEGYATGVSMADQKVAMAVGFARDFGNPIVYSWDRQLYTMKPTPNELKMWCQSRLRFMDTLTSRSKGALRMARGMKKAVLSKHLDKAETQDFKRFTAALEDMGMHFDDVSKARELSESSAASRWRLRRERQESIKRGR